MIRKEEMMDVLLTECPSFQNAWREFQAEWQEDNIELPIYVALADFARHIIEKLKSDETKEFPAIFRAIERLHTEGDGYVREAAIIGILESLQNENLHSLTTPDQFERYLGPESRRWWDKLNRFWDGDASALSE